MVGLSVVEILPVVDYEGTLFYVSHGRESVTCLATQILEIKDQSIHTFDGSYE